MRLTQRLTLWGFIILALLYTGALWIEHNGIRQPVGTILMLLVLGTAIGGAHGFSQRDPAKPQHPRECN